jgi:hypothetical protein
MIFSSVERLFFISKLLSLSGASQLSLVEFTGCMSSGTARLPAQLLPAS